MESKKMEADKERMIEILIKKVEGNIIDWGKNEKVSYQILKLDIPELEKILRQNYLSQYGYELYTVEHVQLEKEGEK